MGLLDGKVALVSGVGPGMGRDIALQLAQHGADVVLGARTTPNVDAVAAEVEATGRKALRARLDVTDEASCQVAVDAAVAAFGRVDILVNNAFHDGDFKLFEKADFGSWRHTMDVNFWGTLTLARELGRYGIRVNGIHPGYIWSDKVEWYIHYLAEKEGVTYEQKKAQLEG